MKIVSSLRNLGALVFAAGLSFQSVAFAGTSNDSAMVSQSDWYLHVDVGALKLSSLRHKFGEEPGEGVSVLKSLLGDKVVDETRYVTMYGDIEDDANRTVLAKGNYAQSTDDLIGKWKELGLTGSQEFEGKPIYFGEIKKIKVDIKHGEHKGTSKEIEIDEISSDLSKEERTVYAAFKSKDVIIMSQSLDQVKYWLNNENEWKPASQDSLFEVVVDIEESMMHGGINLEEAAEYVNFESISAQKLKQFSVTYKESASDVEVQVGLKAADTGTANKVLSVARGLLALTILSEKNPVVLNLLNSVQIEQDAEELLLILAGPVDSFEALIKRNAK
ncbi:MAG: hypothetical protein OQJ89_12915 [Kangiellaceae bacterium]|nr:hypothetical protein [Kangiellaceae bacterium]MCW8999754.1 hypothetical protein [Kangiellaceae bacterium]MCW9017864.1 hypothetical protein [Kangiellaceae bacterium]